MQFLFFLAGLAVHFLIELFEEWLQTKKITWLIHLWPAGISIVLGITISIFATKLNLAGNLLNICFVVIGFMINFFLQKLFKWTVPLNTTTTTVPAATTTATTVSTTKTS